MPTKITGYTITFFILAVPRPLSSICIHNNTWKQKCSGMQTEGKMGEPRQQGWAILMYHCKCVLSKHHVRTNSKWVYECTLSLFIVTLHILHNNEGAQCGLPS